MWRAVGYTLMNFRAPLNAVNFSHCQEWFWFTEKKKKKKNKKSKKGIKENIEIFQRLLS
jgi:hypothetical protein